MSKILLFFLFLFLVEGMYAQRKLPTRSKEEKQAEQQIQKRAGRSGKAEDRWDPRRIPGKSKGIPEVSSWHTGTAGIIASDAAEISLFNPTRVGFSRKTELLFRIGEEAFLPNVGLKHLWWSSNRLFFSSEHTLYYTYPGLKILQNTGFKDLVPDTVQVDQGLAMRHELILSWLMNPRVFGCPNPAAERILSLRLGTEFYLGPNHSGVKPFDYAHLLYHTQLLDRKLLYYGGLQFDSYFSSRFHYSLNALFYSIDLSKEYAAEGNLRLTCYVSQRIGISASCKVAYMDIAGQTKIGYLPLLDLTYLVNPGRATIRHGLYKNKRRRR